LTNLLIVVKQYLTKGKEKNMSKELSILKIWLKKEGNTESLLAHKLGYRSSGAITMWFKRGKIPHHAKERVKEFIK